MKSLSSTTRLIAALVTVAVFATILVAIGLNGKAREEDKDKDKGSTSKVAAEPWPMFGGSLSRNMVNLKEKNICSDWTIDRKPEKNKNVLWVQRLGSKSYAGPVIGDGKIFIGTNNDGPRNPDITGDKGVIMCFDQKSGEFLWQSVHDKLAAGLVNDWPQEGICSSPFVEGKRIYYVSNRCELICATTEGLKGGKNEGVKDEKYHSDTDADIVWRLDMIGQLGVFPHNLSTCSPLVVGDTVFLETSNGVDEGHSNVPKPEAPSFLAVDKNTGKEKWSSNLPSAGIETLKGSGSEAKSLFKRLADSGKLIMHGQWSNPVYANPKGKPQVIFPGGNGWLYAFNPANGDLIWKFDCNPKSASYELGHNGTRSDFIATPVVYNDKLYIGVGQDPEHEIGVGHFWCIDITKEPKNKEKDLSPVDDDFDPKSSKNKDSGLVWHYGGVRESPKEGESPYYFGRTMSTAAIHDGLCYVAELDGYLHCLDAETGKQYWEHKMDNKTWSSPYWVDNKIYLGNNAKEVLIFAHGKEKKLLKTINMREEVCATPVAADGVLYVMTETRLYAIKEK